MIPEPITIDGRTGTVVYLDDKWHPVSGDTAVLARVLFDDGGSAFYTVTPAVQSIAKFDEAKHPRDEEGQFTTVGITAARPGVPAKEVFGHMHEFAQRLTALSGVSDAVVQPGVGAWQGGSEPTWVVSYRGNGEATKLLAETGQQYNQDAVLVLRGAEPGKPSSPATEWTFEKGLSKAQREAVGKVLVEQGVGGWTWFKDAHGNQVLRTVSVPQWGGTPESHEQAVTSVTGTLVRGGLMPKVATTQVQVEIMEREGEHSYEKVLHERS